MTQFISIMTIVFTILVKFIGFPDQIKNIQKRRSTEGVSFSFFFLSLLSYTFWVIYGFLRQDWVTIFGQGLGVIASAIIIFQFYLYKKK